MPPIQRFTNHYKDLPKKPNKLSNCKIFDTHHQADNDKITLKSLNETISIERKENKKIRYLKKKVLGKKSIINEILKCSNVIMIHKLHLLFNIVLNSATIHEPGAMASNTFVKNIFTPASWTSKKHMIPFGKEIKI